MTVPVDVRTLHFRHPNAETGETDNHAVRIAYADIATIQSGLNSLQSGGGDTAVQLRFMDLSSNVKKVNYTIPAAGVQTVINQMDELATIDGISPE